MADSGLLGSVLVPASPNSQRSGSPSQGRASNILDSYYASLNPPKPTLSTGGGRASSILSLPGIRDTIISTTTTTPTGPTSNVLPQPPAAAGQAAVNIMNMGLARETTPMGRPATILTGGEPLADQVRGLLAN